MSVHGLRRRTPAGPLLDRDGEFTVLQQRLLAHGHASFRRDRISDEEHEHFTGEVLAGRLPTYTCLTCEEDISAVVEAEVEDRLGARSALRREELQASTWAVHCSQGHLNMVDLDV